LPQDAFDERSFRTLKMIRDQRKSNKRLTPSEIRHMLDMQMRLVRLDEERAIGSIPKLIEGEEKDLPAVWSLMQKILAAPGALEEPSKVRFARVEKLFSTTKREAGLRR
jgi:hypothetical protein